MDFDSAIQAHTSWKLRLFSYSLGKVADKIDMQTLQKDTACALGQWLHGEGRRYAADAKFKQLQEMHAAFHKCAASVGAMVDGGQADEAGALLNSPESEFNRLSIRLVGLLMDLRSRHLIG